MALDDALDAKDIEEAMSFFAEDCQIELLSVKLYGREGVRKWLDWIF